MYTYDANSSQKNNAVAPHLFTSIRNLNVTYLLANSQLSCTESFERVAFRKFGAGRWPAGSSNSRYESVQRYWARREAFFSSRIMHQCEVT